jgi:hypothetical protein
MKAAKDCSLCKLRIEEGEIFETLPCGHTFHECCTVLLIEQTIVCSECKANGELTTFDIPLSPSEKILHKFYFDLKISMYDKYHQPLLDIFPNVLTNVVEEYLYTELDYHCNIILFNIFEVYYEVSITSYRRIILYSTVPKKYKKKIMKDINISFKILLDIL